MRRTAHVRTGSSGRDRWSADERGETLIEIMATVVLMGTAVVAVLSGLFASVVSSDLHKRQTRAAAEVTNVVEAIDKTTYVPCSGSTIPTYSSALPALPSGFTVSSVVVEPLVSSSTADPAYVGTCPGGGDQGAQRITVTVSQGIGARKVTEKIAYVKRDERCLATTTTTTSGTTTTGVPASC